VTIAGVAFSPRVITINTGERVTWVNDDPVVHTVTSGRQAVQGVPGVSEGNPARPSGLFDATLDRRGERFSFKFLRPGRYEYFCRLHVGMRAVVVVS
jgi:plastocyanin